MRRSQSDDSSLELLLDTICNTFGGVLFMAILIVILLQTSNRAPTLPESDVPAAELVELEQQLADVLAEVQTLHQAVAAQEQVLAQVAPESLQESAAELAGLQAHRNALREAKLETLQQLSELEIKRQTLAAQLAELDKALSDARQTRDAAMRSLQAEQEARTQTAKLPKSRSTRKREVTLLVRYGKVYFPDNYSSSLTIKSLNLDDMIVLEDDRDGTSLTPKPYAGLPATDPAFAEKLLARLKPHTPRGWYVAIGIWDDSFAQFAPLRATLVNHGYEYRLIPITDGEAIVESYVPNPLVQ